MQRNARAYVYVCLCPKKREEKRKIKKKEEKEVEENSVYAALFYPGWRLMVAQAPGYILICRARESRGRENAESGTGGLSGERRVSGYIYMLRKDSGRA